MATNLPVVLGTPSVDAISAALAGQSARAASFVADAGGYLGFSGRSLARSSADGIITLYNAGGTDFARLNFGGNTGVFPSIKRQGSLLAFRTADDSGNTGVECRYVRMAGTTFSSAGTPAGVGFGTLTTITDSNTATPGGIVAGGGTNKVLAISNGTNWLVAMTL